MKKLFTLFALLLICSAAIAQTHKGWNGILSYNPFNFTTTRPSYINGDGFMPGFGLSLGVTRSIINLDAKLHPALSFGGIFRHQYIVDEKRATNFRLNAIDIPIGIELGAKNFGINFGFSFYCPVTMTGNIYNPDSSSTTPYAFGDNNTNADKELPWAFIKTHAGVHLCFYNKEKTFRFAFFSNVNTSLVQIGPFKKGAPYPTPKPAFIEAGIMLTWLKKTD